jgi:predicted AlkP superfamily pyrophosphatase or phosphodiesterase
VRFWGYRTVATMVTEIERLLHESEPFIYGYYDGLDKVAHEYGLGSHFAAELNFIDRVVDYLLSRLPPGAVLLVTADHGQVDVGRSVIPLAADVVANTSMQSGEGRFRWLHARPGRAVALYEAAVAHHGGPAWVVQRDKMIADGWFGPHVREASVQRLGDVALVAREDVAFYDPHDTGPYDLVGRHGSLTSAEMLVPLLTAGR